MRKGLDKTIEREVREGDRARGMRERRIGDVICGNKNRTKTPIQAVCRLNGVSPELRAAMSAAPARLRDTLLTLFVALLDRKK